MMKVVLDTNVVVSGLLWTGAPRRILEAADDERIFLFTSRELLEELAYVLHRPKFKAALAKRGVDFRDVLGQIVRLSRLVVSKPFAETVIAQDPSDDMVLACAVTAAAEVIVSGDEHLLALKRFRGIPILSPNAFLQQD